MANVERIFFEAEGIYNEPEPGLRQGQYLLLREIHQGGMGTVHLAKRVDDQYEQVVAIKTVRGEAANAELSHQFRHEQQILATLSHPNVGSIFDGGETPAGMPYLVMEYVEGVPITTYCTERNLLVRRRLELFSTTCGAVYHAQGKLILHRGIKPENVLVSDEEYRKLKSCIRHTSTFAAQMLGPYGSGSRVSGVTLEVKSPLFTHGSGTSIFWVEVDVPCASILYEISSKRNHRGHGDERTCRAHATAVPKRLCGFRLHDVLSVGLS